MGTFAETAIFDYRCSFADQGKQTSSFSFYKKTEIAVFHFLVPSFVAVFVCVCVYLHTYMQRTSLTRHLIS